MFAEKNSCKEWFLKLSNTLVDDDCEDRLKGQDPFSRKVPARAKILFAGMLGLC